MTLSLWIDPDDAAEVTLDGSTVRQINDKSAAGNNLRGAGTGVFVCNFNAASPDNSFRTQDAVQADLTFAAAAALVAAPSPVKFGDGSLSIPAGSPTSYVETVLDEAYTIGTNDFTVEVWAYYTATNTGSVQGLFDMRPDGVANTTRPAFYMAANGTLSYYVSGTRITGTTVLSPGQWYHIALCRTGTTTRIFLDGVQEGSDYTDSNNYLNGRIRLGAVGDGVALPMRGYIDSVRFYNGTALYPNASPNFTPPSVPFPDGPGRFPIQYVNKSPGRYYLDATTGGFLAAENRSPNLVNMDGPDFTASIAFDRSAVPSPVSERKTLFGMGGFTSPVPSPESDAGWKLEDFYDAQLFRVSLGGEYFDLTSDPAASLLCNFDGDDAATVFQTQDTGRRTVTFQGTAQLDTAQKKFNKSSLLLDGNSDYIEIPDAEAWRLEGDFTVECWIRFNTVTTNATFVAHYDSQSGSNQSWIFGKNGADLRFTYSTNGSTNTNITRTWSPSSGVWYHVVAVRIGTTFAMFVDGAQLGATATVSGTFFNSTDPLRIGAVRGGSGITDYLDGWVDDVRIKNSAAYPIGSPETITVPTRSFTEALNADDEAVVTIRHDGSSGVTQGFVNGRFAGEMVVTAPIGFGNNLTIGGDLINSNYEDGKILETIYFDGVLPFDDINRLEGYLAHKWNFFDLLPADHPYALRGPDKAGTDYLETVLVANFNTARTDAVASPPGYTAETGQTFTFFGNANLDIDRSKFSGSSLLLDGTGDYLETADSPDYTFDGDLTIECWVYFNSVPTNAGFVSHYDSQSGNNRSWIFGKFGSNLRFYTSTDGATTIIEFNRSWSPSTGQWYHCAVTRKDNIVRMFIDGVQQGADAAYGSPEALFNCTDPLRIGATRGGSGVTDYMNGSISGVRIINGRAIYTKAFTPPIRPFQAAPTLSLLANFSGLDAAASPPGYASEEGNNYPMTFAANAQLDTEQKKFGYSSLLLDGTGDYAQFPVQSPELQDFAIGTNDFTIEGWIRPQDVSDRNIIDWGGSTVGRLRINLSGQLQLNVGGTNRANSAGFYFPANEWYHFALTRKNDVHRLWIDGVQDGSWTSATDYDAGPIVLGNATTLPFQGHIDGIRIIKGMAVYGNVEPQDYEFNQIDNADAAVFCNFNQASPTPVTDDVNGYVMDLSSGAGITADERWTGTLSLDVAGSSSRRCAIRPSPETTLAVGTQDFTIELMVYFTVNGGATYQAIFDQRTAANSVCPYIGGNSSTWRYYVSAADRISGGSWTTNQWYHVVVERQDGITRMFVDGVQVGSNYTDANNYTCADTSLGARSDHNPGGGFEGYIDHFAMYIGKAKYGTGGFTPPERPQGLPNL